MATLHSLQKNYKLCTQDEESKYKLNFCLNRTLHMQQLQDSCNKTTGDRGYESVKINTKLKFHAYPK